MVDVCSTGAGIKCLHYTVLSTKIHSQAMGEGGGVDLHLDYAHLFCQLVLPRGHQVLGMATGMPGICRLLLSFPIHWFLYVKAFPRLGDWGSYGVAG